MIFIAVLITSALALAASAAYFSIFGLAQIFSGAFWSIVIMASSIEAGKLVAASFLYRFWEKINLVFKTFLLFAVLVVMVITSMGISGYLTSAYQQDTLSLREAQVTLVAYEEELGVVRERRSEIRDDINERTSQLPPNFVTARRQITDSFADEQARLAAREQELTEELLTLRNSIIDTEAKVGPIIFISNVFGFDADYAIFWLIVMLVLVFDPLAVALTIAANVAILDRQKRRESPPEKRTSFLASAFPGEEPLNEPAPTTAPIVEPEPTPETSQPDDQFGALHSKIDEAMELVRASHKREQAKQALDR